MSTNVDEQAFEQQLDWSLAEIEGGETPPDVTDRVLVALGEADGKSATPPTSRWLLSAAIVALGVGALFGVHYLTRAGADKNQATTPDVPAPEQPEDPQDPQGSQDQKGKKNSKGRKILDELQRTVWVRSPEDVAKVAKDTISLTVSQQDESVLEQALARCPDLEKLHVDFAKITAPAGTALTDRVFQLAGSMKNLRLWCSDLAGDGIEALAGLPELRELQIVSGQLTAQAYAELPKLPSLRSLDLSMSRTLDDDAMQHIARCPGLTSLDIANCQFVGAKGLAHLYDMPKLEILDMSGIKASTRLLGGRRLARLRVLKANNTNLDTLRIGWLPESLEELDLDFTQSNANTARILSRLTRKLRKLSMSASQLDDVGVRMLSSLDELRELDISNLPLTSRSIRHLTQFDKLCKVKISALRWLEEEHFADLMSLGIDVEVTKGKGYDELIGKLRRKHADAIEQRRERFLNR